LLLGTRSSRLANTRAWLIIRKLRRGLPSSRRPGKKGPLVISFRSFRNSDPPAILEVWNESFTNRGAYRLRSCALMELGVYSKPYFDPDGLTVAEEDGKVVGFCHSGFGPNSAETGLAFDPGIICAIAVRPSHRRKGIGSQLLKHAEEYLGKLGSKEIVAGGMRPQNPFYFGLYGGSDGPGFLLSDSAAEPFLAHHGYQCRSSVVVLQRNLEGYLPAMDTRFVALRRRYDTQLVAQPESGSWWQSCVLGSFESVEFRLVDKLSGIPVARALVWETSSSRQPCPLSAGILDVQVRSDFRRQGLGKLLVNQLVRYIQENAFKLAEVQVPEANQPALNLFRGLGFEQVDIGRTYGRPEPPAAPA
jgi:ribosomal protein S18 acetylase RimI-like enzyme